MPATGISAGITFARGTMLEALDIAGSGIGTCTGPANSASGLTRSFKAGRTLGSDLGPGRGGLEALPWRVCKESQASGFLVN